MVNTLALSQIGSDMPLIELPEDEVKWCTVSLLDVFKSNMRLEASVFDIEGKRARAILAKCKYGVSPLIGKNGLATAYSCGRFKRIWCFYSDLPIYQPSSIMDIKPIPDGHLSRLTNTNIKRLKVKRGQILITCSGTIGKVALVSKTLDDMIFSHDLIRVNVHDPKNIGYVYTFLRSAIGNILLQSNRYGAVITHIEPEHLTDIPIPNSTDSIRDEIHDLVISSFDLRDKSNKLIDEAINLLICELQLPPIEQFKVRQFSKKAETNNYSVKLSDISGRIDASYHIPIINSIIEHLQKYADELTIVGDKKISKDIILPGRFKRVYVKEGQGRAFFGGKQISELDPSNKKYLSLAKHSKRIKAELEVSENTILVTRSGTIGKVTLTPKHWERWIASDHIIRIIPSDKELAGYLYVFLLSDYGKCLIKRYTYGSVVDEIDNNHVAQIPFPLLKNKSVQTKINDLALEANKKRYEAYILEQKAMKILNDEVIYAK
jgi:type I restriction enzyme S subunit